MPLLAHWQMRKCAGWFAWDTSGHLRQHILIYDIYTICRVKESYIHISVLYLICYIYTVHVVDIRRIHHIETKSSLSMHPYSIWYITYIQYRLIYDVYTTSRQRARYPYMHIIYHILHIYNIYYILHLYNIYILYVCNI